MKLLIALSLIILCLGILVYQTSREKEVEVIGVKITPDNFNVLTETQEVGSYFYMCNLEDKSCAVMRRLR